MRIVYIDDNRLVLRADRRRHALYLVSVAAITFPTGVVFWDQPEKILSLCAVTLGIMSLLALVLIWRARQFIELDRFMDQITITDCSMKHRETRAIALSDLKEVRAERRTIRMWRAKQTFYALIFRTSAGEEDVFKRDLYDEDAANTAVIIRRWLDGKPQLD